ILSFGGKPVAKYRWFRFSIGWINRILTWIYKE
ncbi:MAG: GNAT family N-acetyltransferase, partial [Prevotella sp.]|nr:GNAT family N-acetyltransferase [Prevotella sp.]